LRKIKELEEKGKDEFEGFTLIFYAFVHLDVSSVFNVGRYKSNISNKDLQISRGTRNRNF